MLTRIQIVNLRNIATQQILGLSAVNVFLGDNGAGKTSILEAIHTLGCGRSFRKQGGHKDALVRYGCDRLIVFGETQTQTNFAGDPATPPLSIDRLGLSRAANGDIQIKANGEKLYRLSDMALRLPTIALNSDTFDLLTGAAGERRRYIDWAVFHVEHRFRETSKRYANAVQQRNSILRRVSARTEGHGDIIAAISSQDRAELDIWTQAVAELGSEVGVYRERQFSLVEVLFEELLAELGGAILGVKLSYRPGWSQGSNLHDALAQGLESDIKRGFTQFGPHRADLQVLVRKEVAGQARLARDVLSRGQLKLVVLAMKLAQVRFFQEAMSRAHPAAVDDNAAAQPKTHRHHAGPSSTLTLLLDDVAAEFDATRLASLGRVIAQMLECGGLQVFATSTTQGLLAPLLQVLPERCHSVFHVEHGEVSAVE
jgi:DNA replication and repair protein RecF